MSFASDLTFHIMIAWPEFTYHMHIKGKILDDQISLMISNEEIINKDWGHFIVIWGNMFFSNQNLSISNQRQQGVYFYLAALWLDKDNFLVHVKMIHLSWPSSSVVSWWHNVSVDIKVSSTFNQFIMYCDI